jgi:hypothetical protein
MKDTYNIKDINKSDTINIIKMDWLFSLTMNVAEEVDSAAKTCFVFM